MLTLDERVLLREACLWLLDQDHDDYSGDYLWFLTPSAADDPANQDEIVQVRELLRSLAVKLESEVTT